MPLFVHSPEAPNARHERRAWSGAECTSSSMPWLGAGLGRDTVFALSWCRLIRKNGSDSYDVLILLEDAFLVLTEQIISMYRQML
jgi:hypothetical protein